jgi:hypothetical protein
VRRLDQPVGRRLSVWLTLVSAAVFATLVVVAWNAWESDFARAWDMPVYAGHGERITRGDVPYRDFRPEYPPGALPWFVIPALDAVSGDDTGRVWAPVEEISDTAWRYARAFAALMVLAGLAAIVATSASLAALRRPLGDWLAAHTLLATSPILLGGLLYTRYDLVPAALVAVALALLLRGRDGLAGVALGAAISAKLYPLALVPLFGAYVWRTRGRPAVIRGTVALAATLLLVFGPFLVVAPSGLLDSLGTQGGRGLQVESTPASVLVAVSRGAWKAGFLDDLPLRIDEGEVGGLVAAELRGRGVEVVGAISTAAVLAVIAWTTLLALRRRLDEDELVRLAAIVLVTLLALGQVLSPQFLVWLIPVVPLVAGPRGRWATGVLALALVVTHVWFPDVYRDYVDLLDAPSTAVLLLRNALLIGLLALLAWPRRRPPSAATT